MKTWIALLRAVNVGGRNKLPMKMFASELEAIGLADVKTYIQSGNVVFRCPQERGTTLAAEISASVRACFGFTPHVAVISAEDLAAAVTANPFPEAVSEMEGKTVHLFFLAESPPIVPLPAVDKDRLETARRPSERWQLQGGVFYLHTPQGFADSKLAAQAEKILGVPTTARNWRTACALLDLTHNYGE